MAKVKSVAAIKIGKRIRAVRTQLGISLEDLGELSEISWTNIGKIERGDSSPTAESLVRIATALEVDPGMFLSGVSADDYGRRSHRFTVRDLIKGRDQHLATGGGAIGGASKTHANVEEVDAAAEDAAGSGGSRAKTDRSKPEQPRRPAAG